MPAGKSLIETHDQVMLGINEGDSLHSRVSHRGGISVVGTVLGLGVAKKFARQNFYITLTYKKDAIFVHKYRGFHKSFPGPVRRVKTTIWVI